MTYGRWPDDALVDDQDVILTPFSLDFLGMQYTAVIEIPIVSVERSDGEVTLRGGVPRIVAEVARPLGSDVEDFIDLAVERSKRDRGRPGPALVAGGFSNWTAVSLSFA